MVDMSKDINKTGTGLGLFISKKLSLKLGPPNYDGIQVNSQIEKGTKFSFILDNKLKKMKEKEEYYDEMVLKSSYK